MLSVNTNVMAAQAHKNQARSEQAFAQSVQRLASGQRINSAKDDAAGSSIINRMTASLRANSVVTRGLNDTISLMQVAEGGLDSINDMIQRARTLAVQAANGTLSDADRASISNEFQQLRAEIDQVARTTTAFGKFPLAATSASPDSYGSSQSIKALFGVSGTELAGQTSGVNPIGFIPRGSTNVTITVDGIVGAEDDIQLFSRDGTHLVGTPVSGADADYVWVQNGITSAADLESALMTEANGFLPGATYNDDVLVSGDYASDPTYSSDIANGTVLNYNGMEITYTGDGDQYSSDTYTDGFTIVSPTPNDGSTDAYHAIERLHIDEVTEDLFLAVVGVGSYDIQADWDYMPDLGDGAAQDVKGGSTDTVMAASFGEGAQKLTVGATPADSETLGLNTISLGTQNGAGAALARLDDALEKVASYRGQYGALTNRFESAIQNLAQERISLSAARSRIADTDYAAEISTMVRTKMVQEAGMTVMAQANQLPNAVLTLLR